MICALVAAATIAAPAPSVSDFFPLIPGTKWEYHETGAVMSYTYRDEVRAPEEIEGKMAWPIVSLQDGKEVSRTYYRVEGDTVFIVAYDAKKPLGAPNPIFKLGTGRVKWEFSGQSVMMHDPVALTMQCESAPKGKKNVLGQDVDVIEVRLNGTLGGNSGTSVKSNQVAYYAKGIGLVEMQSDNRVGPSKSKTQLKLIKFVPPAQD